MPPKRSASRSPSPGRRDNSKEGSDDEHKRRKGKDDDLLPLSDDEGLSKDSILKKGKKMDEEEVDEFVKIVTKAPGWSSPKKASSKGSDDDEKLLPLSDDDDDDRGRTKKRSQWDSDSDEDERKRKGKEALSDDDNEEEEEDRRQTRSKTKAKQEEDEEEEENLTKKPTCKYGSSCYRSNQDHLKQFWHPSSKNSPSKKSSSTPSKLTAASSGRFVLTSKPGKPGVWRIEGSVHILDSGVQSKLIAAFDLDHTLVKPKGKKKFPVNRNDWEWLLAEIKPKLKQLHKSGYKIVIFSNQGGIEKAKQKVGDITGKITDMVKELGIPVAAFIAGALDAYRKPSTILWRYLESYCNGGLSIDYKKSFFCGDAAGRAANWTPGKSKDFNCSDRAFAENIGVPFFTPEEYFLDEAKADFEWNCVDPKQLVKMAPKDFKVSTLPKGQQELVILTGPPASGKSSFFHSHFGDHKNYVHVNRDTLKTKQKCLQVTIEALNSGKSVVVDNTNPSKDARREYLNLLATRKHITARAFVMFNDLNIAYHLNAFRERTKGIPKIPDIAYRAYKSKFVTPSKAEGFIEVTQVPFVPHFSDDNLRDIFLERTSR